MYKYIVKNVARKYGKTVTLHAEAAVRRQRLGHAHARLALEGRRTLFAGSGYAGLSDMAMYAIGGLLKHAPAILRLRQPDDQQLQAAGAGLRGAGEPGLLAAQPLGVDPHPDVQPEPEGEAARVPLPRPELQPVPGVLARC